MEVLVREGEAFWLNLWIFGRRAADETRHQNSD